MTQKQNVSYKNNSSEAISKTDIMAVFLTEKTMIMENWEKKKTMQPALHHVCAALDELRLQKNEAYNVLNP